MNPPFTVDDICTKKTREDGSSTYLFARTKAAKTICAKMQLAIEVFDSREDRPEIWYYADGYYHPGGAQLIGYFLDEVAQDLSDSENINDVFRRIRGKLRLKPVEFDITNPYLVGCKGGITLDLRTGQTRKAAPMDLISMPIPAKYDPAAKCPEFIKFLYDVTATDDDRLSIIDFLASLLIAESMDFFVAAPGLGSNGRSVLKNFIRAFVGSDACRSIPLKDLGNRFTAGFLTRCRVNFCNETEINGIILEFIKRSGEKMPIEQKFKGMINVLLYLKYFFDTNTMPAIADTSYGAERRICRWDMPWRFCDDPNPKESMEKQRDPEIINRLTTDEELSGVLNMVLERAPEVIKRRMIHHGAEGLQEYTLQSRSGDVFLRLFMETTLKDSDKIHSSTLREQYLEYCTVTNSTPMSRKAFNTFVGNETKRLWQADVRINEKVSTGFTGILFRKDVFVKTLECLNDARKKGNPVFQALLNEHPNIREEYTTFRSKVIAEGSKSTEPTGNRQKTDSEITISNLFVGFVGKYSSVLVERNEVEVEKNKVVSEGAGEEKQSTKSTKPTHKATDADSTVGSPSVFDPKVLEFLQDGGQASRQRFLAEFPQARRPEDEASSL